MQALAPARRAPAGGVSDNRLPAAVWGRPTQWRRLTDRALGTKLDMSIHSYKDSLICLKRHDKRQRPMTWPER